MSAPEKAPAATADTAMRPAWTVRGVRDTFARWRAADPSAAAYLDAEALDYFAYHAARYAHLLAMLESRGLGQAVLDVGPNLQTALLRTAHPELVVDTLGFAHPAVPPRARELHYELDLNSAPYPERWPLVERRYHWVVLAEVVEHLHVPLASALACLAAWLEPGGRILVQTPNAAALHKRLRLLRGRNPIEPPRLSLENPGHFHEYTVRELRAQVSAAGLVVEHLDTANYFGGADARSRLYRAADRLMAPTLRHGITLCVRAQTGS